MYGSESSVRKVVTQVNDLSQGCAVACHGYKSLFLTVTPSAVLQPHSAGHCIERVFRRSLSTATLLSWIQQKAVVVLVF